MAWFAKSRQQKQAVVACADEWGMAVIPAGCKIYRIVPCPYFWLGKDAETA